MDIKEFVKAELKSDHSGHDFEHALRVADLALLIAKDEGGDLKVIEAASLLHDCVDSKLFPNNEDEQMKKVISLLIDNGYEEEQIEMIEDIISKMSWHLHKDKEEPFPYIEGNVVRDADRLEALGAIGIIRAIEYGNNHLRPFYNEQDLERRRTGKTIVDNQTTLSHFYGKLLLLEEHFATKKGKELAHQRNEYLKGFIKEFYIEIETK